MDEHQDAGRPPRPTPYPRDPRPEPPAATAETAGEEAEGTGDLVDDPADEPPADPAGPHWRGTPAAKATGRIVLALVSVVALIVTGYAYVTKGRLQSSPHTADALTPPGVAAPPADDGATDILLVGSDARTDADGNPLPPAMLRRLRTEDSAGINTDTIIILRIPRNGGTPSGVSIPRDSYVDVTGRGKSKINSVYGVAKDEAAKQERASGETDPAKVERDSDDAGRRKLVEVVQDLTQVRIDHYAEINLFGFFLLTEALGGVTVCLNHATEDKDSGANFPAGVQTVSGGAALSFVRQRHNLPRGDLDRIVRQQAFLSSALHQVLSAGTLASPGTLDRLLDAVHRSVAVDPGLDLLDLVRQAKRLASGDLSFTTIPVVNGNGRSDDGRQSVVIVDPAAVRQFVAGLVGRGSAPPPTTAAPAGGGGGAAGGVPGGHGSAAPPGVPCVD